MPVLTSPRADDDVAPAGTLRLRFRGPVSALSEDERRALFQRGSSGGPSVRPRVQEIISRVQSEGDRALFAMARDFDGVQLEQLEVPKAALRQALDRLDVPLRRALDRSAENVARVHRAFLPRASETSPEPGIIIGRRPDPLGRVGVYAPGGRAVYPSSVLMGAVPARVAGVGEVILCSPPARDGLPSPTLLAAAALAGVDRVFALGGAGAIAAMALGTESVPRVDRVVGPGNAYVAEAKLQLTGAVAIDSPAGPSELLVIAAGGTDRELVAREMLAQAEHDPLTCVVTVVIGETLAVAIERAMIRLLGTAERKEIMAEALAAQGGILTVDTLDEATAFATRYSPEHLLIALSDAEACDAVLRDVRNAGTIFVGETSSNAFGDYMTGANHVLPTAGLARSYSGLSVLDFVRWTTYQRIDRAAAARLAEDVGIFADAEELPGHASAARAWSSSVAAPAPNGIPRARPELTTISAYTEAKEDLDPSEHTNTDAPIDLSDNTNLWGTPPAAEQVLREPFTPARYPSPYSAELKQALAGYVNVEGAGIVAGCGSDDVLDAAMRAFASPGDCIAYSAPTFSMIPVFGRVNGLELLEVPLGDESTGYDLDSERLVATGARIIYVCAPNNPTATAASRKALEYVVANAPHLVILDEAYAEFAPSTNVDLVRYSNRLLVTRTLSKAFGLAGLRIGYGVATPEITSVVERARGPYQVNAAAERAAVAALADTPEALGWVRERARMARESRDRLARELASLGLPPLPSAANFVLVPTLRAREIGRELRRAGIIVRVMSGLPFNIRSFADTEGRALRISVGPWPIMERVIAALAGAVA
jgi:histidinol dehydrogenase